MSEKNSTFTNNGCSAKEISIKSLGMFMVEDNIINLIDMLFQKTKNGDIKWEEQTGLIKPCMPDEKRMKVFKCQLSDLIICFEYDTASSAHENKTVYSLICDRDHVRLPLQEFGMRESTLYFSKVLFDVIRSNLSLISHAKDCLAKGSSAEEPLTHN